MPNPIPIETEDEEKFEPLIRNQPIQFDNVLSTGSTLLDLAISGNRIHGGGIPAGIMIEVFGSESTGKTAILSEVLSCAQQQKPKGRTGLSDPEGRFSDEHARIYDMELPAEDYSRPDTVKEMFKGLDKFLRELSAKTGISVYATDSLAALSTEMEMKDEDKMGMRRAKDFSEGFRKYTRMLHSSNALLLCSNQIRESDSGLVTPGGRAVRYYSDVRIELKRGYPTWRLTRTRTLKSGRQIEKQFGVISDARIVKNSLDEPFREAPIHIQFGYGVDDNRANLDWYKWITKDSNYGFNKQTSARGMDKAIWLVEGQPDEYGEPQEEPQEKQLKEAVIDLWYEVQDAFTVARKPKQR